MRLKTLAVAAMCCLFALPGLADEEELIDVAYGEDDLQTLDIYLPPSGPLNAPVLVMVHGGGWRNGDKANTGVIDTKNDYFLPKGYVTVSVNYRLMPDADPVEQAADVAQALAYIQTRMLTWGTEPSNMIVMGHSAGAHLVAYVGANPLSHGLVPWTGTIVLDTEALNIPDLMADSPSKLFVDAFGTDPTFWDDASPDQQLVRNMPPYLMVCSVMRRDVCRQSEAFRDAVRGEYGNAAVMPVKLRHAAINQTLGDEGLYTSAVHTWMKFYGMP